MRNAACVTLDVEIERERERERKRERERERERERVAWLETGTTWPKSKYYIS